MAEEAGAQMKIVWLCRRADDATEVTVTIGLMRSSGGVDLILQGRGVGWCGRQGAWAGASCSVRMAMKGSSARPQRTQMTLAGGTEHVQAHGFMPIHPSRQVLGVW
ncbi:hypothetical protein TRIUR3_18634 [Triticum urartu]|uniref:Uncharacterized protein n=1 Tax=Triticum urartu TaxID=4572 RepID=M7Z3F1_TRIUA|nr:hypothetical protein TRIUR3_18634 [Triticum urartu]